MNDQLQKSVPDVMNPFKKKGIAGVRAQVAEQMKNLNPNEVPNRLGMMFDDSGSMGSMTGGKSENNKITDAKTAVGNFLSSCKSLETSIALYTMSMQQQALTCDYSLVNLFVGGLTANAGTPLYTILDKMTQNELLTRIVIFSDGEPTDGKQDAWAARHAEEEIDSSGFSVVKRVSISRAKDRKINCDTVYLGPADTQGYDEMKWIAEQTGGIFVHFEDSASLSKNLKYLSPALRFMLANEELKKKIEKGETI